MMPRLIRSRSRWRDDQVLIALEEIPSHDPNMLRPAAYKGEIRRGKDALVKSHPDLFAEAPVPQGPPGRGEPYAVPKTMFRAPDGRMIMRDQRFHPYDPLVLTKPGYFHVTIPND